MGVICPKHITHISTPSQKLMFALIFSPKFCKISNYGLPQVKKKGVMVTQNPSPSPKTQTILVYII